MQASCTELTLLTVIGYTETIGHSQMYFQSVDELNEHVKNDHKEDNAEHTCEKCSQLFCSLRVLGQAHHMFSRFLNLRFFFHEILFVLNFLKSIEVFYRDQKCIWSPRLVRFFGP